MGIEKAIRGMKVEELDPQMDWVFMSDMHLGCGDNADETVGTEHLIRHALQRYLGDGYGLVLLGDTFELAETHDISKIKNAHPLVMELLQLFHAQGRLRIVRGNHDMYLRDGELDSRTSWSDGSQVPFLTGIQIPDAVRVGGVLGTHGHQNKWMFRSWFNKVLIWLGAVWRGWQMHHSDFHSMEANGWQERRRFDMEWEEYAKASNQFVIVGHSHIPTMGDRYANCGTSGVMRNRITATELVMGATQVRNVDFMLDSEPDGSMVIRKDIICTKNI